MKIHVFEEHKRRKLFFFTKDKNNCLKVEYDPGLDFGEHDASGVHFENIVLDYQNGYVFGKEHKEITINDVP
ncbi:protein of unknown function [Tenacibaculum sp. 190524A02b]|uniref:hypothetical protein n=1 Tax=Tenacibaculum vairaonense TaxID=3137860 RepID=UPI0032B2FACA